MRVRTKTGFSMVKCQSQSCGRVSCSNLWRCRCRLLWTKCPRHVLTPSSRTKRPDKTPSLKKQREAIYGVDRPLPKVSGNGASEEHDEYTDLSGDECKVGACDMPGTLPCNSVPCNSGTQMSSLSSTSDLGLISDYRRRKNREITRNALSPRNSFARFKESFMRSSASAALKARISSLMDGRCIESQAASVNSLPDEGVS